MRKLIILLMLVGCLSVSAQVKVKESKTTFAREALQPYLDKGTRAGDMLYRIFRCCRQARYRYGRRVYGMLANQGFLRCNYRETR